MASNEMLRELAEQAANWLKVLAPSHSESKEIRKLANDLATCAKGCAACGSADPNCPCERDD